jgi:hypothetical protein
MSSSTADQTALLKEVLGALKSLQLNQAQLSSSVDAISGRVNVLAGMKEVHDVAKTTTPTAAPKKVDPIPGLEGSHAQDETKIPESPSLPATQVDGETSLGDVPHAPTPSTGTSRIILT